MIKNLLIVCMALFIAIEPDLTYAGRMCFDGGNGTLICNDTEDKFCSSDGNGGYICG